MSKGKLRRQRRKRHQDKQVLENPDKQAKRPHRRIGGRSGNIRGKRNNASYAGLI